MWAAVIAAPRKLELARVPQPRPGPRESKVRLEGCGVCGSNLPVWEGREWFQYPLAPGVPGHEAWGRVEQVGEEVTSAAVGDRVATLSSRAFSEFDLVPEGSFLRLPEDLDGPFPGEPLACAFNVFRRAEIREGQMVAVIGVGFLGAVLTRLASSAGAKVIAISRRPFALRIARDFGAWQTIGSEERRRIVDRVSELTDGRLCERVIEVVGLQEPLALAGELTQERGRLVIAGYHQDGLRQVDLQLWNWRGLDVINAHERDPAVYLEGMKRAVDAVRQRRLDPTPLYSSFKPDELGSAFERMSSRPDGFVKGLVLA